MQDRTLLAQRLMLWWRWSLRFSPIRPTAQTWRQAISISVFKLSPCSKCNLFLFGQFPGVWVLIADVSELTIGSIFIGKSTNFIDLPMKMEPIVSSETMEIRTQTPGNCPKRNKLRFPFLSSPQEGSQGDSFHLTWWGEASCDVVDQTKNSWILHWRHA